MAGQQQGTMESSAAAGGKKRFSLFKSKAKNEKGNIGESHSDCGLRSAEAVHPAPKSRKKKDKTKRHSWNILNRNSPDLLDHAATDIGMTLRESAPVAAESCALPVITLSSSDVPVYEDIAQAPTPAAASQLLEVPGAKKSRKTWSPMGRSEEARLQDELERLQRAQDQLNIEHRPTDKKVRFSAVPAKVTFITKD